MRDRSSIRLSPRTNAVLSLAGKFVFALYNGYLGVQMQSLWFLLSALYYLVLALMRCFAILGGRAAGKVQLRMSGITLMGLAVVLALILSQSLQQDIATRYSIIPMITIATVTSGRIALNVMRAVKFRRRKAPLRVIVRNIGYAETAVSLFTMQQSMLVSFEGMEAGSVFALNLCTGSAVCLFTLYLGLHMLCGTYRKEESIMEKKPSPVEKLSDKVTSAYKAVETTVVDGYKKVETTVVDDYTKIEDKFVDTYLKHDGETLEEAKARLKGEAE